MKTQEVNVGAWLPHPHQRMSNIIWVWICHWKRDRIPAHPVLSHWQRQCCTKAWCDRLQSLLLPSTNSGCSQLHAAASSFVIHKASSRAGYFNMLWLFCTTLETWTNVNGQLRESCICFLPAQWGKAGEEH